MHGTAAQPDHPTAERTGHLPAVQDILARTASLLARTPGRSPGSAPAAIATRDRGVGAVLRFKRTTSAHRAHDERVSSHRTPR